MIVPIKCPDCGGTHFVNVGVDYTKITYPGGFRNNVKIKDKVRTIIRGVRVLNIFSATSFLEYSQGGSHEDRS